MTPNNETIIFKRLTELNDRINMIQRYQLARRVTQLEMDVQVLEREIEEIKEQNEKK